MTGPRSSDASLVLRLKGGLGNQMFQYATGLAISVRTGARLLLDTRSAYVRDSFGQEYQLDSFSVRGIPAPFRAGGRSVLSRSFRVFRREWNRRFRPFAERRYIVQEGTGFDARIQRLDPSGTVVLEGHWEDERYFEDVGSQIRTDFTPAEPLDRRSLELAEEMDFGNSVAVHVRALHGLTPHDGQTGPRQDVPQLDLEYYQRAIKEILNAATNPRFYWFGDHLDTVERISRELGLKGIVVDHNREPELAYRDLWLMSRARHHVIANSTFSWWGAWLAEEKEGLTVAPSYVGVPHPEYPERWHLVSR